MFDADLQSLQIRPDATDPVLAQQQTRFNTLVQDVALWRAALAEWKERIARYHVAVEPVRRELHEAWRRWASALDHAGLQHGLSRAERAQLGGLHREAASLLLDDEDDAGPAPSDDDLVAEPVQDWEQQAAAAAAQRAERSANRRAANAAKQRNEAAQEVSQSLRGVYRRLASTLHPDREPDTRQRERKTALMQQANQAYAEQNLLALLELQLQAEQIDAAHLAAVDQRHLQHYVDVLQEQLADLQSETRRLEAEFRAAVGLPPGTGLQARKADRMISSEVQRMRGELVLLRRQTRLLGDVDATKEWLREERKS
jgi:hypothetical protein